MGEKGQKVQTSSNKTSKRPGDVIYSMVTTVNNIVYWKLLKGWFLKIFHHKKKKICNSVCNGCYTISSVVITSQYTDISSSCWTPEIDTMSMNLQWRKPHTYVTKKTPEDRSSGRIQGSKRNKTGVRVMVASACECLCSLLHFTEYQEHRERG